MTTTDRRTARGRGTGRKTLLPRSAPRQKARRAAGSRWGRLALRVGLGARCVIYLLVGYLALRIALTSVGVAGAATGQQAAPTGAVHTLAEQTGGRALVALLALGLLAYAVFRFVETLGERTSGRRPAERWIERAVGYLGALLYLLFTAYTFSVLVNPSSGSASSGRGRAQSADVTARVLAWPVGQELVGLVAVGVLVAAGVLTYRAFTQPLDTRFDQSSAPGWVWRTARVLGAIGHAGRALAFGIVGGMLFSAAVTYDADSGQGLDGSLRLLAHDWYGPYLLFPCAVGLVVYGLSLALETVYGRRR